MSVAIKFCGITRVEDALAALECGADMLGLNFYAGSPRCVTLERAQEIAAAVAGRAKRAGVFVNMNLSAVLEVARAVPLDVVQLHGGESLEDSRTAAREFAVVRALRADASFTAAVAAPFAEFAGLLLDTPCETHGGSGVAFDWAQVDWSAVRAAIHPARLFLAGGLHAGNVGAAIAAARPDVVDVCSGVEAARGIKSVEKMREFAAAVRAAERQCV